MGSHPVSWISTAWFKEVACFSKVGLLAGTVLAGSGSTAFAASCESLLTANLPHVTVTSAQSIPAGTYQPPGSVKAFTDLPAFCRVVATVTPVPDSSIGFEVWLPTDTWNGRYQQVGNHGWGGVIYWSEMAPQLRRGFATGATDDGHVNSTSNPFDISWGIDHPVKVDDMAWRAAHELAVNAKGLIAAYYEKQLLASYFNGCSDGGREGMREAHDFPADFDGILAGGAATGWTHAATEQLVMTLNLRNGGIQGPSGTDILALAQDAVTAACDAADGVTDGLINNPRQCRWDPRTLVCQPGEDPATCITPAQGAALAANLRPVRDPATGEWVFSGMPRGSEFEQIRWKYNYSLAPFGLSNYRLALGDPNWDGSTFDLHADLPKLDRVLGVMNMTDPDLRRFAARGGKLIQWHGWDDGAFTPGWTTKYYGEVVDSMAGGRVKDVQDFYRLFMLPGVGHCAAANDIGPDNIGVENQTAVSPDPEHDAVSALLAWVERGVAPQKFIATKFKDNDTSQGIQMQRPICPYPSKAVWNGSGNIDDASSFHCGGSFSNPW